MHWPPFRCSAAPWPVVSVLGRAEESMFPAGDSPIRRPRHGARGPACAPQPASSPLLFSFILPSLCLSLSLSPLTLLLWVSRIENKVSRQFFSWSPDLNGSVSLRNEGLCWLAECSESLGQRTVFWCPRLTDPLRRGGRGKKSSFNYRGRSMVLAARSRPVSSASTWQGVLSSRRSAGVRPAFVRQLL